MSAAPDPAPARRRAALVIGLDPVLPPERQREALRLWDSGYALQRPAALPEYIAELARQFELSLRERHELRLSVYQALMKHDPQTGRGAAAGNAPAAAGPKPAAAPVVAPRLDPPPFVVFACMSAELMIGVRKGGPEAVQDFAVALEQHAAAAGLRADQSAILLRWARNQAPLDALAGAAERVFAGLFHAVYVATAEALGPVAADRLLARATQVASALPEASRFAPTRLL